MVPFSIWDPELDKWKREGDQQGAFIAACFLIVNARCQLLQVSAGLTALALETILLNGEPGLPLCLEVALLRVFCHGCRNATKLVPILIPYTIFLQSFAGTGVPMFCLEPVNLFEFHSLNTSHEAGILQSLFLENKTFVSIR